MNFHDAFIDELVKIAAPYTYKDEFFTLSGDPKYRFFTGRHLGTSVAKARGSKRLEKLLMAEKVLRDAGREGPTRTPVSEFALQKAVSNYMRESTLRSLKSGKHSNIFTRTSPFGLIQRVRYKFSDPKKRAEMIRDRADRERALKARYMRDLAMRMDAGD